MAHILSICVRSGSAVFHRWSPFLPSGLSVALTAGKALSNEQLEQLRQHVWLIDPPQNPQLPDVMGNSTGPFVVSSDMRSWLSAHQPNLNFYSVCVRSTAPVGGATEHTGFTILGAIPIVDTMDAEQTAWEGGMYGYADGRTLSSHSDAPCVAIKALFGGLHIWKTSHKQGKLFMCSNEFREFMYKAKLRGFDTVKSCKEV